MPRMTWRAMLLLVVFALLAASHGQARRESDSSETVKPGPALKSANEEARSAYKAAREHLLAQAGPIVLFDGDALIFRYGSHRRVRRVVPALYEDLKTVGHMVMGLHALIAPYGDGKLDERRLFVLARYLESVESASKAVVQLNLNKERLARQQKILDACRAVLKKVIADRAVVVKDVMKELRAVRP